MKTSQKNELKITIHQLLKISVLTGKLKHFRAINTNTLSNPFCNTMQKTGAICSVCYSAAMLKGIRQNCVKPWEKNSNILSSELLTRDQLPVLMDHTIRLHAHGELINYIHLLNFIAIAQHNPLTVFALWTKRKNLIRKALKAGLIPDNLILIYSHPKKDKPARAVPVGFHKVFSGTNDGKQTDRSFECTGKSCHACMACYRKDSGHDIIIERIK